MKNILLTLMVFGVVGCAEPPKPEKYGYDWERIFLNQNIGISLLCTNNNSTVSFLLISEKEDWKNTDEKMPGTFEADFRFIKYKFYDRPVYSYMAYEVYRSNNSSGTFKINNNEMRGYALLSGIKRRPIKLNRESLSLHEQLRYGGDGNSYWSRAAQCEVSDNMKIANELEKLKNRANEEKRVYMEILNLEKKEVDEKNKI